MLKVKTLKLKGDEDFGKRFKECREWKGLSQKEIKGSKSFGNISQFERGIKIGAELFNIIDYIKALDIKNISISLNENGPTVEITPDNYGPVFKSLRDHRELSMTALVGKEKKSHFLRVEKMRSANRIKVTSIVEYAKALGIKTLIINID